MNMCLFILIMVNAVLNRSPRSPLSRDERVRLLVGVRREDWRRSPRAARKLAAALAERSEIAYCVIASSRGEEDGGRPERRAAAREHVGLRSAKFLDAGYRFVCECRICDRSQHGLRLLLARNVKPPGQFAVHIDETSEVREAKIVWRKGAMLGVRLGDRVHPCAIRPSDRYALRERYYGILD